MKQTKLKLFIAASLFTLSANTTYAAGIPVIDAAAIAQLVSQISMLTQQFNEMQQHTAQLQTQINNTTGSRALGNILNDPAIKAALPADWINVMTSIRSSPEYTAARAMYPTSTDPKMNALFDTKAINNATLNQLFKKANGRLVQVQDLLNQIDSASDPAAKADLQNRLQGEQNAIVATSQLVEILKEKQAQEEEIASRAMKREWFCKEFKRSTC